MKKFYIYIYLISFSDLSSSSAMTSPFKLELLSGVFSDYGMLFINFGNAKYFFLAISYTLAIALLCKVLSFSLGLHGCNGSTKSQLKFLK